MTSRPVVLALAALALAPALAFSTPSPQPSSASVVSKGAKPMAVPFIDDDYAKAISKARAAKLPVFVEAWAPW
jgi:hypothetical protein